MGVASSYIYGAGNMGREVLAHWRAAGIVPTAFIDRMAARVGVVDGVPVIPLEDVRDAADSDVLVALHSPGADVHAVVDAVERRGFARVDTLWSACRRGDWLPALPYWLAPHAEWAAERADIAAARALLEDDVSRAIFDAQLRLRTDGCYATGAPTREDQYFPRDLARWRTSMRLVDCGAYDGDTLRAARSAGYAVEGYVAFEPDPINFAALSRTARDVPGARLHRAGVGARRGVLRFAADGGPSARVDDRGAVEIDVVPIDEACVDFDPTFVKMDIEGAERDALDGGRATLARCRPALALAVNHRPDDLWRIPLQVDALGLGYRFRLRSHAYCGFDTVLYATA